MAPAWVLCRGGCGTLVSSAHRAQGYCAKCFPGKGARAQKKRLATLRAQGRIKTGRELLEDRKPIVQWLETAEDAVKWKRGMEAQGYRVSVHFAGEGYDGTAYPKGPAGRLKRGPREGQGKD
jgi:hypothetical protein